MRTVFIVSSLLIFLLSFSSALPAYAACTSPGGDSGALDYDDATKTRRICDGTTWKTIEEIDYSSTGARISNQTAYDSGTCTAAKTGRLRYNGATLWEYCNGTNWVPFEQGACAGPVSCPQIGNICSDGSIFIGCPVPNGYRTYVTRCNAGQTGTSCTGTALDQTWSQSISYCDGLTIHSKSDWYLPNRIEMWHVFSHGAAVGQLVTNTNYWTSEQYDSTYAWFMGTNGIHNGELKTASFRGRCLRHD